MHHKYVPVRVIHNVAMATCVLCIWRVRVNLWYMLIWRKLRVTVFRYWIQCVDWWNCQFSPLATETPTITVVHPSKSLRHGDKTQQNLTYLYMAETVLISSFQWYIIWLPSINTIAVETHFLNKIVQPINQFRVKTRGFPPDVIGQHRVHP